MFVVSTDIVASFPEFVEVIITYDAVPNLILLFKVNLLSASSNITEVTPLAAMYYPSFALLLPSKWRRLVLMDVYKSSIS